MSEQEPRMEVQDDSINPDKDKTLEEKNELKEEIESLPKEDEIESKEQKKDDKVDRSEIAQKIRWREKFREERKLRLEAETRANASKSSPKEPSSGEDDKDAAARRYIKDIVDESLKTREEERTIQEQRELEDFENQIDEIVEDHSDVSEEDLLNTIEEYNVEPKVALRILERQRESVKKEKPKMPAPKRASPSAPKEAPDDRGKSFHQIAQDVIKDFKSKFSS